MSASIAFVTKSYVPDLERCRLLCRSVSLLAPDTSHWIIVDARDRPAFRDLENETTRIVTTEELLPKRVRKLDLPGAGKNLWVGTQTRPMRGWLVQQLAKLAINLVAEEDILIHADSDVVLIRPFVDGTLQDRREALPLYRVRGAVDEHLPNHVTWHRTAERLLGLQPQRLPLPDYIGGLVPWDRRVALSLLQALEARSGRDWMRTLSRQRNLSEYVLYGRYVDDVLGRSAGEPAASRSLCHCYWGTEPLTTSELESFIDEAAPEEVGVMISAKAGMDPADYSDVLERRWAKVPH